MPLDGICGEGAKGKAFRGTDDSNGRGGVRSGGTGLAGPEVVEGGSEVMSQSWRCGSVDALRTPDKGWGRREKIMGHLHPQSQASPHTVPPWLPLLTFLFSLFIKMTHF